MYGLEIARAGCLTKGLESRITSLLQKLFWRSTRALAVICKQMGVPDQEERKVTLEFSSVERHFYERQLEATLSVASEISERNKKQGKKLHQLAEQLYTLRAACCHPQVGSAGINRTRTSRRDGTYSGLSSQVMSMHEILCKLIDDARLKCEEAQRLSIMHTNAAAALTMLKVEAKKRKGVDLKDSDLSLYQQSCKLSG